jgi:hypothetical protein
MPTSEVHGLEPDCRVIPMGKNSLAKVGFGLLGRVIDGAGNALDDKGPLRTTAQVSLTGTPINPLSRKPIREPLDVGVRAINSVLAVGRGQRMGLFAGTGVGKSLFMCHVAAAALSQGRNVLYITLEMAEERIAERVDANLMNITMDQLKELPKALFDNRMDKIKGKTQGNLIIKEYPTTGAHVGHFKALLNELQLKRQFKPDLIVIDYLNICASSRLKASSGVNSYTLVKSIAEELRGLAVEENVPILSATQTTRTGFGNTDVELTDTSESFGLPATVDFMFALISTEDLEKMNQLMVKQLKNRYNDPTLNKRFVIGVDRAKMKLYDLEESAQKNISDSGNPQRQSLPKYDKPPQSRDSMQVNKDIFTANKRDFSKIRL